MELVTCLGRAEVTAGSEYELELACKEVRRHALRSKLQLVRLAGEGSSLHVRPTSVPRAAMTPRLPAHRVTTAHMGTAYPFHTPTSEGLLR